MGNYTHSEDVRKRWTGAETFHRDGKQELWMGDCRLRSGQGQTRHMHLVMLAYSLLTLQLKQNRANDWALARLTTIGQACRAVASETLRTTITWAIEQVAHNSQKTPVVVFLVIVHILVLKKGIEIRKIRGLNGHFRRRRKLLLVSDGFQNIRGMDCFSGA